MQPSESLLQPTAGAKLTPGQDTAVTPPETDSCRVSETKVLGVLILYLNSPSFSEIQVK